MEFLQIWFYPFMTICRSTFYGPIEIPTKLVENIDGDTENNALSDFKHFIFIDTDSMGAGPISILQACILMKFTEIWFESFQANLIFMKCIFYRVLMMFGAFGAWMEHFEWIGVLQNVAKTGKIGCHGQPHTPYFTFQSFRAEKLQNIAG